MTQTRNDLLKALRELQKAGQNVCDETDRIHDTEPWPVKYRAPYGAIAALRAVLDRQRKRKHLVTDETIKIFSIAHVLPTLENAWLQHLRDFDVAHPGCHFEVIADAPETTFNEAVEMLKISPGLSVTQIIERKRPAGSEVPMAIISLLPDDKVEGLRVLDAARRMVETFKR